MMKKISTTELRNDIYRLLDKVIESGEPIQLERKGRVLKIVPEKRPSIETRLKHRDDVINGEPEELIHCDWSSEWEPSGVP